MIPADVLQRKIDALPEPVLNYLYSERAGELNLQIIERHGVSEAQEQVFFLLLRELFVKELPLERLILELKQRLGLDDAKAKALAVDIAGYRLLPLDKWLGDVGAYLRANGADPKAYPADRVQVAHRTIDEAAEDIAAAAAPESDPRLKTRLGNIVESFLSGVRTESQTLEVLTRPEKVGGAGLNELAAKHVLEEVREETRTVVLDHKEPVEEKKAEKKPEAGLAFTTEDALEVARFKKTAAPSDIEAAVQEIYQASGLATDDEAMRKRIMTIIGNRLRDVRDQMETLEIMTQPKELGGLNLSQEAARNVLNAVQARLRADETASRARLQTAKALQAEKERVQKAQTETRDTIAQKAQMEQLYQSVVGPSAKTPVPPATAVSASSEKSAPPANLPIAAVNPVPPDFRPPEPRPLPATPEPARAPPPPPVTVVRPTPAAPSAPALPVSFSQRPKMEDVKASPKLTGPVEELRAITLVDFRRLSRDPQEACGKVKAKIDLLAGESYTRRNEGIAAWTASEVMRVYFELMRDGLNGKPVREAIAAREAAKQPTLRAEEFQALADLSRQLRY